MRKAAGVLRPISSCGQLCAPLHADKNALRQYASGSKAGFVFFNAAP
jgi:hypothetical protein